MRNYKEKCGSESSWTLAECLPRKSRFALTLLIVAVRPFVDWNYKVRSCQVSIPGILQNFLNVINGGAGGRVSGLRLTPNPTLIGRFAQSSIARTAEQLGFRSSRDTYLTTWVNSGKSGREQALRPMAIRQARLEPLASSVFGRERMFNGWAAASGEKRIDFSEESPGSVTY